MSVSMGAIPSYGNYYSMQHLNSAASQTARQGSNNFASQASAAASSQTAVGKTATATQSDNISDKSDPNYVCQTCKERKYQDQSNDPGVSFKAPTHIAAGSSAAAVMSHEQEHVSNEKASASSEGRKIVSQTVVLHNAVCPECHKPYVSGGETTTVTASDNKPKNQQRLDVRV